MSMKKHLRHVLLWIYDKNNQIKGDDAVEEIREVYGHDSIGRMTVFRWLKKFRNGDKNVDDLEDDPRSGRPSKFNEKFAVSAQDCPSEGYWTPTEQPYCNDTCGNCGFMVQDRVCDITLGCPYRCNAQVCKFPRQVCCYGKRTAVNNVYDGYFKTTNGKYTLTTSTTTTTTTTPSPIFECQKINCNFENLNMCSYYPETSIGVDDWHVQKIPYKNRLTGIYVANEGSYFLATYLQSGQRSIVSTNVNYPNGYVIKFNWYKATQGIDLKICCDTVASCPFSTTTFVTPNDYLVWKKGDAQCPVQTTKFMIVCENSGRNQGACGVDNVYVEGCF